MAEICRLSMDLPVVIKMVHLYYRFGMWR